MPKLLGTGKSRTFRVLWMLEELGISFEHIPAAPRTAEITQFNPSGKVPVFVTDDGAVLTDSSAIITYLADHNGRLTHPTGTTQRAAQDAMSFAILDELDGALWTSARHSFILPEDMRVPQIKESLKWEFAKSADRIAERMAGPFVMGDELTIPDILLAHCAGWSMTAKFNLQNKTILDHLARMQERPAYIRARQY